MKAKLNLVGLILFLTTTLIASNWSTSISKDEMTSENSAYATSTSTAPNKIMDFPYQDVQAWVAVGCNKNSEWVYVGFTTAPNLNDVEIEDGYNTLTTRIKFDNKVETISLSQSWGSKFLHFNNDKKIIAKIARSNSLLLELNWHGNNLVYFNFSLNGSSSALKKIRQECKK